MAHNWLAADASKSAAADQSTNGQVASTEQTEQNGEEGQESRM